MFSGFLIIINIKMFRFISCVSCLLALSIPNYCCNYYSWNPLLLPEEKPIDLLILARGGSKGIKLKNLAQVAGKSLLRISLQEVKKVRGINSVWVSTDHNKIITEAAKENVNIHLRSAESATDEASSIEAVREFLENHPQVNTLGLIQCTSPFIKVDYLQIAVNYMSNYEECVFSVSRSRKLRWAEVNNNTLRPLNFDPLRRSRRQNLHGEIVENGMFYFFTRKLTERGLLQSHRYYESLGQNWVLYVM